MLSHVGSALSLVVAALVLAGCGQTNGDTRHTGDSTSTGLPPKGVDGKSIASVRALPAELVPLFEEAAREFGVPAYVLVAISYLQTHWQHRRPPAKGSAAEAEALRAGDMVDRGHGLMGLYDEPEGDSPLEIAARLVYLPPDSLRTGPRQNVRGAAALLAHEFVSLNGETDKERQMQVVENWRGVLRRYTRYEGANMDFYFSRFSLFLAQHGFPSTQAKAPDSVPQ